MQSVHAIYDGQNVTLLEEVAVKTPRQVIVTFLDEPENGEAEEPLSEKFERLFEKWYEDTAPISGSVIFNHPNYQKMIDLGKPAVPLMLVKLKEKPHFLFLALQKITGEDPVPKEHAKNFGLVKDAWLDWGRQRGLIQ